MWKKGGDTDEDSTILTRIWVPRERWGWLSWRFVLELPSGWHPRANGGISVNVQQKSPIAHSIMKANRSNKPQRFLLYLLKSILSFASNWTPRQTLLLVLSPWRCPTAQVTGEQCLSTCILTPVSGSANRSLVPHLTWQSIYSLTPLIRRSAQYPA